MAFALSELTDLGVIRQAPIGILRQVDRPTYDDAVRAQVTTPDDREAALTRLITGQDSWTVQ